MKRILSFLLVACTLFSVVACDKKEEPKKPVAPANVISFATHSYDKIIANVKPEDGLSTDYTVYMTKGETEGCQLAVYSDVQYKKTSFVMTSGKNDGITTQIFSMENTHTIKKKEYTDSVVPYYGGRLRLEAKKTLPFMVEFKTTADTPAGDYKYVFTFNDTAENKVLATFNVTVHVWDIVMPTEKTFATSVGLNSYHIGRFDKTEDAYKKYYDMLLEHNLCAHRLPYSVLDERADAYMSDPRVTCFVVEQHPDENTDEDIIAYYNKIKSKPEWLKKAIFYPIDEPHTMEHLEEYKYQYERLKRLAPDIPIISPFYTNIKTGEGKDQVDFMAPYADLWCPKLCLWDDSQSYTPFLDYTPEKTFAERMAQMQADGDRMWSYVCNDPISPYAQLFINTDGVVHRLMMWQHYQRNIEGFLYWGATAWGYTKNDGKDVTTIDPWNDAYNGVTDGQGRAVYGEGFLFYPGSKVGVSGPVASTRMKILRDGIDDIELFYLAETILGKEWVMERVNEATPTLTTYTSEENLYKLRKEIGDALEAALAEQ